MSFGFKRGTNQLKLNQRSTRFTCPFFLLIFKNIKTHGWVSPKVCPAQHLPAAGVTADAQGKVIPLSSPAMPPGYCHRIVPRVRQINELRSVICAFFFFFTVIFQQMHTILGIIKPASQCSYIIVSSLCHSYKPAVVGRTGMYFYS